MIQNTYTKEDAAAVLKELTDAVAKGVGEAVQYGMLEQAGYVETDRVDIEDIAFISVAEGVDGKAFVIVTKDGQKLLVSKGSQLELFEQLAKAYTDAHNDDVKVLY